MTVPHTLILPELTDDRPSHECRTCIFHSVLAVLKISYEIARVLKPGGVYLMTDYRDPERVQELFERDEWEGGSLT